MAHGSDPAQQRAMRSVSGGARRYLEMRERERWYRHDGRRSTSSNGPVLGRQVQSDDYSEEMIRRFLDNLEVDLPPQQPPPSQSWAMKSDRSPWSTRRVSDSLAAGSSSRAKRGELQLGFEGEPYWMPPRDIRRELLEAADLLLKAAAAEDEINEDFSGDNVDDSAFSNYLPQSVFDFRSRAAWQKSDHSIEAVQTNTFEQRTHFPSSGMPAHGGRRGNAAPSSVFPRIHLPSMHQQPPSSVSQPTSRAPSPAPTLDQLIETLKSSSASDGDKFESKAVEETISNPNRSIQPFGGLNRQVFLVKRYHPLEVPNLISATCSLYDDQFSETSV